MNRVQVEPRSCVQGRYKNEAFSLSHCAANKYYERFDISIENGKLANLSLKKLLILMV